MCSYCNEPDVYEPAGWVHDMKPIMLPCTECGEKAYWSLADEPTCLDCMKNFGDKGELFVCANSRPEGYRQFHRYKRYTSKAKSAHK